MIYEEIRLLSSGGVQQNLNLVTIKKRYHVSYPSFEEQHQIVQEIESRLSVCDKIEESITEFRKSQGITPKRSQKKPLKALCFQKKK